MSAGPIKAERAAHTVPRVSTTNAARICLTGTLGRGYCGRRRVTTAPVLTAINCADCLAAARADGVDA